AAETGLAAGTPVCAGGGDMPCMAVGSGVVEPGVVGLGIGTAAHAIAYTEELDARAVGALWPLCHPHPGGYAWLGCSYTGGASLRWLRDIFSYDSFREICTEAEGVAPGSEGLFFAPWLEGTATPSPDASARGAYIGLTLRHERGHLIRALMEGVAFDLRQSLECFLAIELSVSTPLRFGEGGSRSALWCQIVADVMGRDLQIIETEDLSAVGAALIAAVGVGQVADFAMGAEIAIVMGDRVEVDPDRCKLYDEAFQRYRDLYPRLQNWFITPVKS
ncbi:uncharacterized protein METZ01_LOCUS350332, partial [marine metagenome]